MSTFTGICYQNIHRRDFLNWHRRNWGDKPGHPAMASALCNTDMLEMAMYTSKIWQINIRDQNKIYGFPFHSLADSNLPLKNVPTERAKQFIFYV